MTDALVRALIAHFDGIFAGPNGDYPAVLQSLAGVTAEQAAWKPAPDHNSIWQIVEHLTASKVWQIEMLDLGQADLPVWKEPAGGEAAWSAALRELKETHERLKEALGRLTDKELLTIPVPETKETQLELLLSIAAHEAHHSGQIDYLKGLQAEPEKQPAAEAAAGIAVSPRGQVPKGQALAFSPGGRALATRAQPPKGQAPSIKRQEGSTTAVSPAAKKRKK